MDKSNEIELLQAQLIQERALVQDLEAGKSKMILDAIEVGGQFSDLREAVRVLKEVLQFVMLKAPGYDWNTDPLSITLMVGNALTKSNHVLAGEPDEENDSLQAQLTQRTAELEAIERILDIDSGKTTVEKVRDLHHSFKQVWESYQDASNEMFKAQAELKRVRGELDHAKKMEAVQKEVADNQTWHVQKLRALILALPKVEGQFEVGSGACYYVRALDGKSNPIVCGLMTEQAVAYAILALLKHRQGMEG